MATQTQQLFPMEATLPPPAERVSAFLSRDTTYEGVFFPAVRTTGIFCRPCKRCHPMKPFGAPPTQTARSRQPTPRWRSMRDRTYSVSA